jgi:methionine-gamma-lyase
MKPFDPIESLADMRHEFGEHGGVNLSIETSTTFTVLEAETMPAIFQGQAGPEQGGCYLYGRHFNPTVYVLGRQIAAIEGAEAGYCSASGMSAIAATVLQLCDQGDHIVSSNTLYGGTYALFEEYLPAKCGLQVSWVDISDLNQVENAMRQGTRLLYAESMANPTLRVANIPALAEIAHRYDAKLIIDNTFTPMILSPIQLGADIVVHSLTKFLNGASDVVGGVVVGRTDFVQSLMDLHKGSLMLLGPTLDPRLAYEVSMRLPHLGLRMTEHSMRALVFAERLLALDLPVSYPGLASHQDHELLSELGHHEYGFGGLFTLDLGSNEAGNRLMNILQNKDRFGFLAVSLGYFETLMSASASSTSSEMSEEAMEAAEIQPGLVRFSIGYTGTVQQRWNQMEAALREMGLIQ